MAWLEDLETNSHVEFMIIRNSHVEFMMISPCVWLQLGNRQKDGYKIISNVHNKNLKGCAVLPFSFDKFTSKTCLQNKVQKSF